MFEFYKNTRIRISIIHSDNYHYEIVPSIIELFPKKILKLSKDYKKIEYVICCDHIDEEFKEYILETYKNVNFITSNEFIFEEYDYVIYDSVNINRKNINVTKNSLKEYYIFHRLCKEYNNVKNVVYLTPLSKNNPYFIPNILPYSSLEKIKTNYPILIIAGAIERRDFTKLESLLEKFKDRLFIIKIIGKSTTKKLPECLLAYKDKIIYKPNLPFKKYHKEFLDVYAILPSIDPVFGKSYFQNKLTSSISYGIGYKLVFFCHKELKNIYKLKKSFTYLNDIEMYKNFKKMLDSHSFYNQSVFLSKYRHKNLKFKKIFLIGFPKSGTSTIDKALRSSGLSCAHWKIKEGYVGDLMYKGLREQDNPWFYLSDYQAITQADVCFPDKNLNYWPNIDFSIISKIKDRYPDCLFLLNYRNPDKIIESMTRWSDLKQRIIVSEIIGLPKNKGTDYELKEWIESHFEKVRKYFENDINFLEIDIEKKEAALLLGSKLGINIKWWGVENKNYKTK